MKALSLTPPWPGAILHLDKRIENREGWNGCSYRGPVLLHAAKGIGNLDAFDSAVRTIADASAMGSGFVRELLGVAIQQRRNGFPRLPVRWAPGPGMLRGGICGRARIVDVIDSAPVRPGPPDKSFDAWVASGGDPDQRRWWFGGFALVLADVEPLPFKPWKGALGLFEVPDHEVPR